ncbi:hypothetical protein D3C72_1334650 [compost metagenome]
MGQTETFERPEPTGQDEGADRIAEPLSREQIDTAFAVRQPLERTIYARPAPGLGFPHEDSRAFTRTRRSQFELRQGLRARPDAPADVVPTDDQVGAVIQPSPQDDVDVGMGGVPMIDRNPVEPRVQVPLDIAHEIAGIGAKVSEFGSVLRRDDEAEMMTVIPGPLRESRGVGRVAPSIEEASRFAVPGHAVSLEIGDVGG